ncbi:MAG: ADP-ribosylglycohydrolase family protein [Bacteroidota bacterium]
MKKEIHFDTYLDKVRGGWVGKCAGGILGAPIEGFKTFNEIVITDELFENTFPNDDLDLQILWLDMLKLKGPWVREGDYAEHWRKHVDFPWNEYGIASRNLACGLDNPDTGRHSNGYWSQSMGSPIRSEIWGMVWPGDPEKAAFYARMDSTLDHTGFSVETEQFLSACASLAFFEDDIPTILQQALTYIPEEGLCYKLVGNVIDWYNKFGEAGCASRIKSRWGDADFTSAPMNIGFTILSIMAYGDSFDTILNSLHFGHDSDCIVATAAAITGIIQGYNTIPEIWKKRVGDELVVSPEIRGIEIPESIEDLTLQSCLVGASFSKMNTYMEITHVPAQLTFPIPSYHLVSTVQEEAKLMAGRPVKLKVEIEPFRQDWQVESLEIESDVFELLSLTQLPTEKDLHFHAELILKDDAYRRIVSGERVPTTLPYHVVINGERHTKGIPFYGSWKMVGPFIHDNPSLVPMDPAYPDHGLASMPSAAYMNHDLLDTEREWLSWEEIEKIRFAPLESVEYDVQLVFPSSLEIDLCEYFYGKGERTIFLSSEVTLPVAGCSWLSFGVNAFPKVWLNGELAYAATLKRKWPMAHNVELPLQGGINHILIRLDFPTDDFKLSIGLKEHKGKHPHQSQWETGIVFQHQSMVKPVLEK